MDTGEDVIRKAIVWKSIKQAWNDDFIFPIPEGFSMPWLGGEVINTSWSYFPRPPPGHQQRLGKRMGKPVRVRRIDITYDKVDRLEDIGPDEFREIREGLQTLKEVGPAPKVSYRVIPGRSRKRTTRGALSATGAITRLSTCRNCLSYRTTFIRHFSANCYAGQFSATPTCPTESIRLMRCSRIRRAR